MKTLLSVVEAKREMQKLYTLLPSELVTLQHAVGRVLRQEVHAESNSPLFDNSAMDGFAVWLQDGALVRKGQQFEIVGESSAGSPFEGELQHEQAIKISTGAEVPEVCFTVVRKEDTRVRGNTLTITADVLAHKNIRRNGEEWKKGDVLLRPGKALSPADVGILASQGYTSVEVGSRPRVAIVTTGSELVAVGEQPIEGQIRNSNADMLIACVEQAGGTIASVYQVQDDIQSHVQTFVAAQREADVVLCSGGVSVGDHDHVLEASADAGFEPVFWKVKQKPGKPMFVARKESCVFVGLPGNPVSAIMCFEVYVRPLLHNLAGMEHGGSSRFAMLSKAIANTALRDEFVRVSPTMEGMVAPTRGQGSHMLSGVSNSIGYVHVPSQTSMNVGQTVLVHEFGWL